MYVGYDFDAQDGSEIEVYSFDFIKDLVAGETITQSTWECDVLTGVDAAPAARLNGPAMIQGTKTAQQFAFLKPGVKYRLTATVLTNLGNVKSLWSHAPGWEPN